MTHTAHITAHTAQPISGKKEEGGVTRVIACTAANQAEFRAAMKRWPAFEGLAREMHQQGLLDGLRGCSFALTGSAEFVTQGLDAIDASKAVEEER